MFYLSSMRFFVFIGLILLPLLASGQAKRAQSLVAKDKTSEAITLLQKSLQKDSLASAEKYVFATILFNKDLGYYDLDSSYYYTLESIRSYNLSELKQQARLVQDGFGPMVMDSLKRAIEFTGFVNAMDQDREENYIDFIEDFPTSLFIDSAIVLRNRDSFRKASGLNTHQSYMSFMIEYPEALDGPEARKRYELLLYEEKTGSGLLNDLQKFLVDFPDTWYREETEKSIYQIITGQHSSEAYQSFIEQYPKSALVDRAKLSWYSLLNDSEKQALFRSGLFNNVEIDSITNIENLSQELLILTKAESGYQLMNSEGRAIVDQINDVDEQHKCEKENKFFLISSDDTQALIGLTGQEIVSGDILGFSDDGKGIIRIEDYNGFRFIDYSGNQVSVKTYRNASMVGSYIAFNEADKWGLESITGIRLINPSYDSLVTFGEFLLLKQDTVWAMMNSSEFYPALNQERVIVYPSYDYLEILNSDYLFAEKGDSSALFDKYGSVIIPMRNQGIELFDDGYFLEASDSILDSRLANTWYLNISSNDTWTVGERGLANEIYYNGVRELEVDSAVLLGPSAILIENEGKKFCYFNPNSRISMAEGDEIKPIRKMGEKSTIRHYLFTKSNKKQIVINQEGKHIKLPRFDRLIDLGEDYMIFSVKGLFYNILDAHGKILLKNVDAATSLGDGYISYLSDGKFGLFNGLNNTNIKAKYDRPLKEYGKDIFIAEQNDQLGLINQFDSLILPIRYDEIKFYNDSIAVLKSNFRWTFYNLNTATTLLDNVSDFWEFETAGDPVFKIFRGIGYGIWSLETGIILNSTFGEIEIRKKGNDIIYIAEKWVEEADLVIMLYYNKEGELIKKNILSTDDYEALICPSDQ